MQPKYNIGQEVFIITGLEPGEDEIQKTWIFTIRVKNSVVLYKISNGLIIEEGFLYKTETEAVQAILDNSNSVNQ